MCVKAFEVTKIGKTVQCFKNHKSKRVGQNAFKLVKKWNDMAIDYLKVKEEIEKKKEKEMNEETEKKVNEDDYGKTTQDEKWHKVKVKKVKEVYADDSKVRVFKGVNLNKKNKEQKKKVAFATRPAEALYSPTFVFENATGTNISRICMESFHPNEYLHVNAIACWALVLNGEEIYRSREGYRKYKSEGIFDPIDEWRFKLMHYGDKYNKEVNEDKEFNVGDELDGDVSEGSPISPSSSLRKDYVGETLGVVLE
ncbi:hypothetical protein L1987_13639 [Smallanthus sonchifolius]|uniref:Uncharacterized protein n=1 Tax=Smallanthus sonchifolius TaxID=185202 RepID=A0ACB9JHG7_9ASTR|nr:hypothetical protein L1987_13639 [Smallanthus sonchifolius]